MSDINKAEIVVVVLLVTVIVVTLFALSANLDLYEECINSGKYDKFECHEMLKSTY